MVFGGERSTVNCEGDRGLMHAHRKIDRPTGFGREAIARGVNEDRGEVLDELSVST